MTKAMSIIVTAHNEQLIAHKTMLSIERAAALLEQDKIQYEVLIALDRGDHETNLYFENYVKKNNKAKLYKWDFGDPSSVRNEMTKVSTGEIITFLDADDLISKNWLLDSYRMACNKNEVIHPQYSITFGRDNLIWQKRDSYGNDYDKLCFIDNNLWDLPSTARRDIYIKHPYYSIKGGLSYEDKYFNMSTISAGIKHRVAPETILFVRRKYSNSLLTESINTKATVAPSKLLSFSSIKTINLDNFDQPVKNKQINPAKSFLKATLLLAKKVIKNIHRQAKKIPLYSKAITPIKNFYHNKTSNKEMSIFPEWLITEWRQIHKIENSTFPEHNLLLSLPWYNAENINPGVAYVKTVQSLRFSPNTLFFVPWLIKGGADKVFINYANLLQKQHPKWKIALFQTENKDSLWQNKLSPEIDFINLFDLLKSLDTETQYRLLSTFVVQNRIQRIIIGNSQLAFDFVSQYQTLIKHLKIAVYCFAFGEEFDNEGRSWGHIHTGIPKIYPVLHKIITDNKTTISKLHHEYAFDEKKFNTHYQPTDAIINRPDPNNRRPIKILWASRICKQKRPDLLVKIADQLDSKRFIIHAYGQLEEDFTLDFFKSSKVVYKGAFNGIDTIPVNDYDIYLYTSEGDGMPNMLQEITAKGLPIVASNVGGIGEFIVTDKTGFLINDRNDIDAYVTAINKLTNPSKRLKLVNVAQDLLKKQFSKTAWEKAVRQTFDK